MERKKKLSHHIFWKSKKKTKRVVISTWQSIYKLPQSDFDDFEAVIGDECHLFKAKSLTGLLTKLTDAEYRVGTTGTLDGTQTHKLVIEGLFGRVKKVITTKDLMDKNLLSSININMLVRTRRAFEKNNKQNEVSRGDGLSCYQPQ